MWLHAQVVRKPIKDSLNQLRADSIRAWEQQSAPWQMLAPCFNALLHRRCPEDGARGRMLCARTNVVHSNDEHVHGGRTAVGQPVTRCCNGRCALLSEQVLTHAVQERSVEKVSAVRIVLTKNACGRVVEPQMSDVPSQRVQVWVLLLE